MRIQAVIFDMDGVLIDSEHLWRKAMIKGFARFGMPITEEECRSTMGMRFREVIQIWLQHFKKQSLNVADIEDHVLNLLIELIETEGAFIPGIPEILAICKQQKLRTGLATSSSVRLMQAVLKKLDIEKSLDVKVSAEKMSHGKPHPEVFLVCAEHLGVDAQNCLVIEDSLNGVIAAKAARMQVIAVPDDEHADWRQFALADHKVFKMTEVPAILKKLLLSGD